MFDDRIMPAWMVNNAITKLRTEIKEIGERCVYREYREPESTLLAAYIKPRIEQVNKILDFDLRELQVFLPNAFDLIDECKAYLWKLENHAEV